MADDFVQTEEWKNASNFGTAFKALQAYINYDRWFPCQFTVRPSDTFVLMSNIVNRWYIFQQGSYDELRQYGQARKEFCKQGSKKEFKKAYAAGSMRGWEKKHGISSCPTQLDGLRKR